MYRDVAESGQSVVHPAVVAAVRYTSTTLGFRREYPITDHLGSIRVVLTPDERQSIVSRSDYEPFGAPLSNGLERLSFIGKEQDNESSLGDYGVRKYDPSLGRFMSVDALSDLMPGSSPFHYCFNNPLILRDPSGLIGEIGSDGIPRFTTGEVVVYGERDNSSEDVIRDRKLEWMAKRAAAAAADMAPRAQGGGEGGSTASGYSGDGPLFTIADWINNGIGGLSTGMNRTGGTFRITNSRGISPKHYPTGWRGNGYVSTYNMTTWGKIIGNHSLLVNIFLGVISIDNAYMADGGTYGFNTKVTATTLAGGTTGSLVGAEMGAIIGAGFGGVGALPGGVIGGVIGSLLGGWGGSELGQTVAIRYYNKTK